MRQALTSITGLLRDRRTLILIAAVVTVAVVGCRGGGSNPSSGDQEIPIIIPTSSASECVNSVQPEGAPQFADIDSSRFSELIEGLNYYDLVVGTGDQPEIVDAVSVQLSGWLEDGCMFDTTYTNPEPVTLPLINLITGWREGIAAMRVGGTRVMEIAPDLAFGEFGSPPTIPPNATLLLHVELISKISIAEAQATATVEAETALATTVAQNCISGTPPEGAPTFEQIDTSRFEPLVEGLRFYEIEAGTGDSPTLADTVSVEYSGWLVDGCNFDSSFADAEPVTFPLSQVISGWQEGLSAMQVGGTWIVEISPALGYGPDGFAPRIPPNATLYFYIKLISKG